MRRFLFVTALALATPLSASAAQVHVKYDVDASALKAAVSGTPLTFNFYTDSACATLPIATQVVNVEDIDTIEVLKRFTPKNAVKPPKTARTWHAFSITPSRWRYFVTVAGTGVTPVGDACQEQIASTPVAIASSVPGGIASVGAGFTTLASLPVDVPADGKMDVLFETVLNANDVNSYLLCGATVDGAGGGLFYMDPGDKDTPIPQYDLTQMHHEVVTVTAGSHLLEVACNLSGGADANVFASKIVATFVQAGM